MAFLRETRDEIELRGPNGCLFWDDDFIIAMMSAVLRSLLRMILNGSLG